MSTVYRVVSQPEWDATVAGGSFTGGELDQRDGFVHCSAAHQVAGTLSAHFSGQTNLVLLQIDTAALAPEILRWEGSRAGESFPHVYGPVPIEAVLYSQSLPLDDRGEHVLPAFDGITERTRLHDAEHMRTAIAMALAGVGQTGANPSVGCVVTRAGHAISRAATATGGRPHAEEQALHGLTAEVSSESVVYVTLEPCGERSSGAPSCSALLVAARPARVVVACEDPSRYAQGRGVVRLREAGIHVDLGLLGGAAAHVLYAAYVARLRGS